MHFWTGFGRNRQAYVEKITNMEKMRRRGHEHETIEADAADGYTYFNLSSDSSTGKNGQLAKIVVTLADGSVVVPPVHEHKFLEIHHDCRYDRHEYGW